MKKSETPLFKGYFQSPIGRLSVFSDGYYITSILFPENKPSETPDNPDRIIIDCITQLNEFFQGQRKIFDLPLKPYGTQFQKRVWDKVYEIPFGETASYGDVANILGDSKLSRAVGLANGANPIPIIIPCHRVIGRNGSLTGYAGGLELKKWLLNHEQQNYTLIKGQLKLF